jgi:hypothetical protein
MKTSGRLICRTWLQAFGQWLVGTLIVAALSALGALLLIEWMAGCGESYVDANGVRHYNECVFIPYNPKGN